MNIIGQIVNGLKTAWADVVADIEGDAAKIKAVLPAGAQPAISAIVSDLKQGASDAISLGDQLLNGAAPVLISGLEKLADGALTTYTGGLALPLVGLTNDGIDRIVSLAVSGFNGWALKAKATLAENVATAGAPAVGGVSTVPAASVASDPASAH